LGKSGEIEDAFKPEGSKAAQDARGLEIELVSALSSKRFWSLSDEEIAAVTQGCMSDQCRRVASVSTPQKPH